VRRRLDPTLYLVTDTELSRPRHVPDVVRKAVAGGVTAVQVRDKQASRRALYELTLAVREALTSTPDVALVVNDAVDVAVLADADGVHVGQDDLPPTEVRRLIGPDRLLGLSVGTADDLAAALALPSGVLDLIGLSPVWATPTKPDAGRELGLEGARVLAEAARVAGLPSAAIGGIRASNAASVAATGVNGICVVSDICAAPDPTEAARRLRDSIEQGRRR
jgi:thiamine-phosphate pyrophosphorylase